jgi:TolB-like protein/tetratricopeptide (TPR) repeat protein
LVTKEELFSLVWPKLIVEDTNLHVQVSALRKVLGPAAIATVPGQGYRFTMELTREVVDSVPPVTAAKSDPPGVTFTGSERELADVRKLLGDTRLLTLVGVDASGKTRLLLQVAADVMGDYSDGVWFVELAPLRDAQRVPQAVATVLGVKEEAGRPVLEALLRHITDRRLVLILDNVDDLAVACTELTKQLLQSSPFVKLLVSSRGSLHVPGELIYPVQALTSVAPPIRALPQTFQAMPNAHEQGARRHQLARLRRWQWLAGGVAVVLIAPALWLYQTTKTKPQTTATVEPPTLSIAILPFAAPADEQLAATLMPEITAAFWRNGRSARLASPELVAPYHGKHVDARAIGHELNVRYVAEGEIRRAGDARVLSARLINAANGAQIWTDRFEVPAEELPTAHDAFATRVGRHIWFALLDVERDRVAHQSPTNLTATDLWLRGAAMDIRRLDDALAARKVLEKALELDPRLLGAMVNLAFTYETQLDTNPQDGDGIRKDFDELSLRAIATDRTDPRAWVLRTMALYYNNRLEEALEASWEMQRIEPNHVVARGWRGVVLIALGRSEEALAELDQGIALDPSGRDIAFLLRQKCKAYSFLGQYEKAIPVCEKSATDERFVYPYLFLAADYAQLGKMDKAVSAKNQLLKLDPGFTIARLTLKLPPDVPRNPVWVHQAETYVIPGLLKAGIPEQ